MEAKRLVCEQCQKTVVGVESRQIGTGWVHTNCVKNYRDTQDGLIHDCPKCGKTGKMDHPSRTEKARVPLGPHESPICGYDGCWGCECCRNRVKYVEQPVKVTCDLCRGRGKLQKKPKAVTKVVNWVIE